MENKKTAGRLILKSAIAAHIAAVLIFAGCSGDTAAPPASKDNQASSERPTESIENFRLKQMRGGKVAWELVSSRARFITSDEVALDEPVLKIPLEEGGSSVIRAGRGRVIMSTSEIHTYGSTRLESPDKKVRTTDITYNPSEDKIYTDKSVVIITKDSEITGDSMVSDSRLETITLTNQRVKWLK